ncbi:MAG: hypothetical protein WC325_06000 [Candidatus Bathyarchaeia archaeon]|jgi:hypothetical protein
MISEAELKKEFDKAVHLFIKREIDRRSLANKLAQVRTFDKGSKLVIEREGKPPIELIPEKHVSGAVLRNQYSQLSDFDMIKVFFETLAQKMADQQTGSLIEEMTTHAGHIVNAKGDILGGLIEAAKKLRENGFGPDLVLVLDPKLQEKLALAMMLDPDKAEVLRKLVSED